MRPKICPLSKNSLLSGKTNSLGLCQLEEWSGRIKWVFSAEASSANFVIQYKGPWKGSPPPLPTLCRGCCYMQERILPLESDAPIFLGFPKYFCSGGNIHITFTILTFLNVQLSDINTFTLLCSCHHHPSPGLLAPCKTKTLFPLNNNCPHLFPQPLSHHLSPFCLYESDDSRNLLEAPTAFILLWLASFTGVMSPMFTHAVYIRMSFLCHAE